MNDAPILSQKVKVTNSQFPAVVGHAIQH